MKRASAYPLSDHHDGKRFRDPTGATNKTLGQVLRFFLSRGWAPWPKEVSNIAYPFGPASAAAAAAATFIGHSSVLLRADGLAFITDPVFSQHAGPYGRFGPKRARPPGLTITGLPALDFVLVSHNHYDHMDIPSLRRLATSGARHFVTGLGNKRYLERRGVGPTIELDWWQSTTIGAAKITFVPAQHWSNRTNFDRNRTLWGGFVVETPSATIYFAGDTGFGDFFKEIASRFPRIDLALLPIGAYEPRWFMKPQHMNPSEAVEAHLILGAQASIAIHFGTFRLTPEGFDAPVEALQQAVAEQGLEPDVFRVLHCGETVEVQRR